MLYQPSGCEGPSPQRRKYTNKYNQLVPSSSRASPIHWGDHCGPDDRDCHTQPRRTSVPKRVATPLTSGCVPGPDIATVWTCPTPAYTHTARLCTNNTHSQGHRAVCPSATHMSIKKTRSTKPNRNAATAAQTHWSQSTIWRGHTRSTTSPKKGKRRGYISKEFCANTDLCPLASPRVALVGVCLLRHPDKGNTR